MKPASNLESFIGLVGIMTFIISLIMLMDLISEAFKKHQGPRSLITGLQSMLFPIGTYYYCKSEWEVYGRRFKLITTLFSIGVVSIVISKYL
jgi:hypothetical protein